MGVLNVTPDSFSDGGRFDELDAAVDQARRMARDGADIIDVGGESTRPGHQALDAEGELARVLPVLDAILPELEILVSIDTYKAPVAAEALRRGAKMLNDVWGLQRDPDMAGVAAEAGIEVVLMHNRTEVDPAIDILDDIRRFFDRTLAIARTAGIRDENIILDPGIGFGKTVGQSLTCMKRLDLLRAFGFPVLLGASRKSSIGHVTGKPVDQRLYGTLAVNAWGMLQGADIIRVHDVAEHVDLVKMLQAIREAEG